MPVKRGRRGEVACVEYCALHDRCVAAGVKRVVPGDAIDNVNAVVQSGIWISAGIRLGLFLSNHIRIPHLEFVDQVGNAAESAKARLKREVEFTRLAHGYLELINVDAGEGRLCNDIAVQLHSHDAFGVIGKTIDVPHDFVVMPIKIGVAFSKEL